MFDSVVRSVARKIAPLAIGATALGTALMGSPTAASVATIPISHPLIDDWAYLGNSGTPPSEAACNAVGRRCFNPTAMANSYNYAVLHDAHNLGQGKTIAVVDSFGASTIREDLGVFNTAFGLPHLCGESGPNDPSGNCPSSASPRFDIIQIQGGPPPVPPPPNNGTGQENHNLWDLEVALDVEWAHATAPLANIMLVETPTIPYPSVIWPASDPLVTSVGGTYLCTNPVVGSMTADDTMPPVNCTSKPGDREPAWVPSGGGYSIVFSRPDYQNVLPPGSTYVGSSPGAPGPNSNMRGVPDIAYQASSRTGVLVYLTEPANTAT